MRLKRLHKDIFKKGPRWWYVSIAVIVLTGAVLSFLFWETLHNDRDSFSTTVSNLSLVLGGTVAIVLAVWRSKVSERQTDVAQRQAETVQRDMLNQQLLKGAEMLGSNLLSVRLGGIYALKHLAVDHPEHYHVQVMEQLCAFVRGTTGADGQSTAVIEEILVTRERLLALDPNREDLNEFTYKKFRARDDIQEAMNAIAFCHAGNLAIETENGYWLNLRGADLRGVDLTVMNLSRAPQSYAIPNSVDQLFLTGRYTDMQGVQLEDASLLSTNLSRVDLSRATGLTQNELNGARADPDNPPRLNDVTDARTGKPIVWSGLSTTGE